MGKVIYQRLSPEEAVAEFGNLIGIVGGPTETSSERNSKAQEPRDLSPSGEEYEDETADTLARQKRNAGIVCRARQLKKEQQARTQD